MVMLSVLTALTAAGVGLLFVGRQDGSLGRIKLRVRNREETKAEQESKNASAEVDQPMGLEDQMKAISKGLKDFVDKFSK